MASALLEGKFAAIDARKLSLEACRKLGYRIGTDEKGKPIHIAEYYDPETKEAVAQHLRYQDKEMPWRGEPKRAGLFGQQVWGAGGKRLIITEGEIDCVTVAQVLGLKWPVVSIKSGAPNAVKDIKAQINYVESFEEVVLMFDMDAVGLLAAREVSAILTPGKCKIANLPYKDPNECLQRGKADEIVTAMWNAQPARPDGVAMLHEIFDEVIKPIEWGYPWMFQVMTDWTYGRRLGEIIGFGAGTGVGKTDFFTQQIVYDVTELKEQVGIIFLEQVRSETANRLAGKMKGKAFHIPDGSWKDIDRVAALRELADMRRVHLYNSFGKSDWDRIKQIIRHLALNDGVKLFYLDHLTALADPANERESLEVIMEELASLAQQLKIVIHYISHLSTPEKGSHEEGAQVSLKHFKGARAIGFWTHFAFGLERNKVHEDPAERCILTIRCIKDRLTGRADGQTMRLRYNQKTCRLELMSNSNAYGGVDFSQEEDSAPSLSHPDMNGATNVPEDDPLPF